MTFFEKNTRALLQTDARHQVLIDRLAQTAPEANLEFFETPDGNFTAKHQGVPLHDPQSPVAEAEETIAQHCRPRGDRLHILFGLGLGYLLDQTFRASMGRMIVYEPDLPLLRFVLENIDLSAILGSGRVWLVDSEMDLLDLARHKLHNSEQLDVLALRYHAYTMAEAIPRLMHNMLKMAEDRMCDYRTSRRFHDQWFEQFFNNYAYLQTVDTMDAVRDRFPGKPALVISRGPSLDHSLEAIKALADSTVLIAVGGALRRLHEAGITPDFALFYDANGMAEQLHGLPPEYLAQITFIMSPLTQPCCFETPSRGKLVFLSENNKPFVDWLDLVLDKKHMRLEGGGTVSLIAFQSALAMGCNPVILVGQDLAFPGNQVYAGGVAVQTDGQGRLTLEKSESLYAEPEAMTQVKGQDGRMLPALQAYAGFIRHFEDIAAKMASEQSPVQLYNASIGGALIEGYACKPLSEFVDTFTPWKSPYALGQPPVPSPNAVETRRQQLTQGLAELRSTVNRGVKLCDQLRRDLAGVSLRDPRALVEIQRINQRYFDFLVANPLVGHMVIFDALAYNERHAAIADSPTYGEEVVPLLRTFLSNSIDIYGQFLPCLDRAQEAIADPLAHPTGQCCSA